MLLMSCIAFVSSCGGAPAPSRVAIWHSVVFILIVGVAAGSIKLGTSTAALET